MSTTSKFRAGLLAMVITLPVAGIAIFAPAQDAAAQERTAGWRKELADKVQTAQKAGQSGNYTEAIRLLKETKTKAPLSPQEEQGINELLIWAASGAKDHRLVVQTVDERIATGRVTGADLVRKLRLKATTHYALREYRDVVATLNKLSGVQALNTDDLVLLGNSQVQMGDFRNAAITLEKAVAAAEKAGRPASVRSKLLLALHQAYDKTNNDAKRMQTLHRLMVTAPSKESFKWIASAFKEQSNRDPVVMISLYRLGASRNLLSNEHYANYAETALDVASPGEAVTMLEKGMANGAIKKDDRNNRLLADAKAQVERVKATLGQQEAEAKAIASGEPEAKLATAYYTLKNYSKAAEAAKRGVAKGKLRRPDGLNMLLGISLAEAKRPAEAKNAFKAAAATAPPPAKESVRGVADLWSDMAG